jgi:hypothetical protein
MDLSNLCFFFHDGFGIYCFNMMVLNFANQLFFDLFYKQLLGLPSWSYIFCFCVFVISYYFLNINTVIVGASAQL